MKAMKLLNIIFISFFLSSCMMMHSGEIRGGMTGNRSRTGNDLNSAMDEVVNELTMDLSKANLGLKSAAIWGIESNNSDIHAEMIEDKLVIQVVRKDLFKVADRKKLRKILEEQELSLSGAIDEKSAKEVGKLAGVDGFLYGAVSIHEQKLILSLKVINAGSGVIVWAKEAISILQGSTDRH